MHQKIILDVDEDAITINVTDHITDHGRATIPLNRVGVDIAIDLIELKLRQHLGSVIRSKRNQKSN